MQSIYIYPKTMKILSRLSATGRVGQIVHCMQVYYKLNQKESLARFFTAVNKISIRTQWELSNRWGTDYAIIASIYATKTSILYIYTYFYQISSIYTMDLPSVSPSMDNMDDKSCIQENRILHG